MHLCTMHIDTNNVDSISSILHLASIYHFATLCEQLQKYALGTSNVAHMCISVL